MTNNLPLDVETVMEIDVEDDELLLEWTLEPELITLATSSMK